ncbi:MAG: dipeptide epimerase [Candidatus Abyssubacteria bacterium]
MRIVQFEAFRIKIPFKRRYIHAEVEREMGENIIVRLRSENSLTGIGEAIPREYLTGETPASVMTTLRGTFGPRLVGARFSSFAHVLDYLSDMVVMSHERSLGAAFCAIDLAMLDLAGKYFLRPASDAAGGVKKKRIHYTGPISGEGRWTTAKTALKLKLARFSQVKVKVGLDGDLNRVALVRRIMGRKVDLRVDANCAWRPERAVEHISKFAPYRISSVEQPVGGKDFEGLRYVRNRCSVPIMADESVCTLTDASLLAEMGACDIFNLRLAKCGGITGTLKMLEIARRYSIKCQLGCLVGETSILAAAGRHLAFAVPDFIHVEGSYNRFLLSADVAHPHLGFGLNGSARPLEGYGLGVHLDETTLAACTLERKSIGD